MSICITCNTVTCYKFSTQERNSMIHFRVIRIRILILTHITESSLLLRGTNTLDFLRKTKNSEYHEALVPTLGLCKPTNFGRLVSCEFTIFWKTIWLYQQFVAQKGLHCRLSRKIQSVDSSNHYVSVKVLDI